MGIKLFDSELKVMEALWREGELSAGQLARILKDETGWNRNTTYTVLKKCVDKGAAVRSDPGFICRALITREQVQRQETDELINKMFDGSAELFFSAFLREKSTNPGELEKLKKMVEELE